MDLEINKLINSTYKPLQELGWLLYDASLKANELSLKDEDIHRLMEIFSESRFEEIERNSYEEGFDDAIGR